MTVIQQKGPDWIDAVIFATMVVSGGLAFLICW